MRSGRRVAGAGVHAVGVLARCAGVLLWALIVQGCAGDTVQEAPPGESEPGQHSPRDTATGQDERKPEGFVIFDSEITTEARRARAVVALSARIALHTPSGERNALPYGEADLILTDFVFDRPPTRYPTFIDFGGVGRLAARGAVHAPEDQLELLLRRIPEVNLRIVAPGFPNEIRMPLAVPFYYAPFVLAHSGTFDTVRTIVAQPLCQMPLEPLPAVEGAISLPLPPVSNMPAIPGMDELAGAGMPTGSTIQPVCMAIADWTRLDSKTDPGEQTWIRTFRRVYGRDRARMVEDTRIVVSTCTPWAMPIAPEKGNPWTDDQFLIDPVRQRVLYMSKDELLADRAAQRTLWQAALDGVADQKAFGRRVLSNVGSSGDVISIPKRDTQEAFIEGVVAKVERNGYATVGEMDDMIRGRFDLESREAVMAAAGTIAQQQDYPVKVDAIELPRRVIEQPLCPCGFGYGYPRYHVIVRARPDGLTHEWQIGTKTVSRLYETDGIVVPDQMKDDVESGRIRSDLHDIDYDIFRGCVRAGKLSDNGMDDYERLGLGQFGRDLDQVSAAADCLGKDYDALATEITRLHREAAPLLQKVIDTYGYEAVKNKCYH